MSGTSWLVLSDFDETFWAHDPTRDTADDRERLAELLASPTGAGVWFGFVTGSSVDSVRERLASSTTTVPVHFIGGNLGTELLVERGGTASPDLVEEPSWSARLPAAADHAAQVAAVVAAAERDGIDLVGQPTNGQATYQATYYLPAATDDLDDDPRVVRLRVLARDAGLGISVSHCNPCAGDPDGFLDVDLVPLGTGKPCIARHLQALWGIPPRRTLAFGDSGNDLAMLRCADHSWLVANATGEARRRHPRTTRRPHVGGIVDTIRDTLSKETA